MKRPKLTVSKREVPRNKCLARVTCLDGVVVPRLVVAGVAEQRAVAVEGNERAGIVPKHVENIARELRVSSGELHSTHVEDIRKRSKNLAREALPDLDLVGFELLLPVRQPDLAGGNIVRGWLPRCGQCQLNS